MGVQRGSAQEEEAHRFAQGGFLEEEAHRFDSGLNREDIKEYFRGKGTAGV